MFTTPHAVIEYASKISPPSTKAQSNQIKHRLRAQGMTLKAWAEANNFKYRDVSDVVRGMRRGYFGEGRKIAIALGINPDSED